MSRIGKMPITIPANVNFNIVGNKVVVEGPLGKLEREIESVSVKVENNQIIVERNDDEAENRAKHGLYRSLIANMVKGVSEGFKKQIIINGVGYKMVKQGDKVVLNIGLSHPVEVKEGNGITLKVVDNTTLEISGIDNEKVGQVASKIRDFKPVEPYHAYGIRYANEVVVRKEGKKAGKK